MVNVYEIRPGSYATVAEAKEGGSGSDVTKEYVDAGLAEKQDKLTAGANITIVENVISATGELAGTEWGEIAGNINDQTDLKNALDAKASAADVAGLTTRVGNAESAIAGLDASKASKTEVTTGLAGKQDVLTAGQNITIENNVISASGGSSGGVSEVTSTRETGASNSQVTKLNVTDDGVSTSTVLFERLETADPNWQGATPHFYGTGYIEDTFAKKTDIPDVSGLATKTEVTTGLAGKQDTLVSGTNIKTINSTSLLGSGDVAIEGVPDTTGASAGDVLTFDGTDVGWAAGGGSAPTNMVTTDTAQTITGVKIFNSKASNSRRYGPVVINPSGTSHYMGCLYGYGTADSNTSDEIGLCLGGFYNPSTSSFTNINTGFRWRYRHWIDSSAGTAVYGGIFIDGTYLSDVNHIQYGDARNTASLVPSTGWIKELMPEFTITGDGTTTTFTVTHSLGKVPGIVQVTNDSGRVIGDSECTITKDASNVVIGFNTPPAADAVYTVAMLY